MIDHSLAIARVDADAVAAHGPHLALLDVEPEAGEPDSPGRAAAAHVDRGVSDPDGGLVEGIIDEDPVDRGTGPGKPDLHIADLRRYRAVEEVHAVALARSAHHFDHR